MGSATSLDDDPAQQWSYVPAMTAAEALPIKCDDSADDGRARFAPHMASVDPDAPWDAPPRQRIELRTPAFDRPGGG